MQRALSLVAFTVLCLALSGADAPAAFAQLAPTPAPTWNFDSGAVMGGNPFDTNVAASSTHVCITTRAGFKCFTKSGAVVSPGTANCNTSGNLIRPVPFAATAHLAHEFFSRTCQYVPPDTEDGSTKDGRIVFGSAYKRFFMVFQNREDRYKPARLLIAVSKSEDPRDGWWTYIDYVGGNNNSLDYQFLGVNSSVLVVSNKMKLMDVDNTMVQEWTDQTIYGVAELAQGHAFVKKIWPPYNTDNTACGYECAEQPPFGFYSPGNPPPEKHGGAHDFKAAPCVHETATTDFFWIHRDSNSRATVFARRNGRVTSWPVLLQPAFNPVNGQQKNTNIDAVNPAPPIRFTNGAGAHYQNCVVRNNKLVAVANIGQKWADNPAGDVVTNAIRLIRLDLSNFFATPKSVSVEIDRIYGRSAPDDPIDEIFDYGWPAVATNALGDIVVGSIRTRKTIFPEQRATVRLKGDSDIRPSVSIRTGLDMAGGHYHMAGAAADPTTNAVYLAQEYPRSGGARVHITKMLGTNRPDVIPLSVTLTSSTLVRGATYAASVRIMNQGDAAMPAFKAKLHLSTDDTVTVLDFGLDSFWIRGLGRGETADVPITIAIPASSAAGRYYIGARVDIENNAVEHSEQNNANPFLGPGRGNAAVTVQ